MKELCELIDAGWDIKIWNQVKRMDGDWAIRVCWKAEKNPNTTSEVSLECKWEGFETAEECIQDLMKKIKKQKNKRK